MCQAGDLGLIPGLGRSPGKEKGYPLQYPGQENSRGLAKSRTRLSDFHSTEQLYPSHCDFSFVPPLLFRKLKFVG